MKCLNCGNDVDSTSKFCPFCGSPIDNNLPQDTGNSINDESTNVAPQNLESVIQTENLNNERSVEDYSNINNLEQNPMPLPNTVESSVKEQTVETHENFNSEKKNKTKKIAFIICTIALVIVAAVLLFIAFNKSSKGSVKSLEKALNNFVEGGKTSGTIVATVSVTDEAVGTINVSGTVKYQKVGEAYNLEISLGETPMYKEMKLYAVVSEDELTAYINSSTLNEMLEIDSTDSKWLKYEMDSYELNLQDLGFNMETIETQKLDLSGFGLEKKLKLVDTKDGIKHYTLTIDEELIKNIFKKIVKEMMNSNEGVSVEFDDDYLDSYLDGYVEEVPTFVIELYMNEQDEFTKISIDFSKIKGIELEATPIVSIEFKDFNKTNFVIPNEALNTSYDLETYLNENGINLDMNDYGLDFGDDDFYGDDIDFGDDDDFYGDDIDFGDDF